MRQAARRLSTLTALTLLAACSILPKAESPDIYRLPATALPRANTQPVNWSLRVNTPEAERMIDGSRIAVMPQGNLINEYKGARWSDSATTLLRNRLVDGFRDDGRIQAITTDDNGLRTDYILAGDLRAFQSVYQDGQPVITIQFDAWLVRTDSLRIVATRRFSATLGHAVFCFALRAKPPTGRPAERKRLRSSNPATVPAIECWRI